MRIHEIAIFVVCIMFVAFLFMFMKEVPLWEPPLDTHEHKQVVTRILVWEVAYPITDSEGDTLMLRQEVLVGKPVNLYVAGVAVNLISENDLDGMFLQLASDVEPTRLQQELSSMSELKIQIRLKAKGL